MDSITIIFIALTVVLAIALVITSYKSKRKNTESQDVDKNIQEEHQKLLAQIERKYKTEREVDAKAIDKARSELTEMEKERDNLVRESKNQLESVQKKLEDANSRIKVLELEISDALSGKADEVAKSKIEEAISLANKVRILEQEINMAQDAVALTDSLKEKIETQKNKIKKLEDEIEEAEEQIDDEKKKSKKLLSINDKLQNELETTAKNAKKYLQDFNDTKGRLDSLQSDFDLKVEALDFVKEILTAKCTSDESIAKLYQNVNSTVDYIRNELRDTLKSIHKLPHSEEQRFFKSELDAWAIAKRKSWIQGKVTVAFVGEFSAGKTSIVNRLLSQDDPSVPLLPVSTKATTAIPTYISGGLSTYYQFVTPDNELKEISENTFKRVNKEVLDQVQGVSSLIQYFVMTYKNPNLDRMSILDTPGFNSNDSEDTDRTIGVINECDALFWVFDVNAGTVNRSSLKIIKEHLKKPLYVVINQIDTKAKSDIDDVERLIRKTLEDEGVKIQGVIRFSKKEPLNIMLDPIRSLSRDASRDVLVDDLLEFVKSLAEKAKANTRTALQKSNQIQTKHENLVSMFNRELGQLRDNCVTVSEIPEYNSRWFSADDYRISQEQYNAFVGLLQEIAESESDNLAELYNQQMDTVSDLEAAWKEQSEAQKMQTLLQKCVETLQNKCRLFEIKVNRSYSSNSTQGYKRNTSKPSDSATAIANNVQSVDDSHVSSFKKRFRWAIIELTGQSVKLDWNMVKQIIEKETGKPYSGNTLRSKIEFFGINDFVDLKTVVSQINNMIYG